jgi:hypothetical protein
MKKGTGSEMCSSKKGTGPEYRTFSNPPQEDTKPTCSRSEACVGCPFPANGFICWSENGECMRTRFEKLKRNSNQILTNDLNPSSNDYLHC